MPITRPRKKNLFLPILGNQQVANGIYRLSVEAPTPFDPIQPGQFLMIGFPKLTDPLLPRPFAVFDVKGNRLDVLYKKVGKGTSLLSNTPPGEFIRVFGPLGNGFSFPSSDLPPLIIVGGMGIASVHLLIKRLLDKGIEPTLIYGCRHKEDLVPLDILKNKRMPYHILTEDGSVGEKGTVLDFFIRFSKQTGDLFHTYDGACLCGPAPMLKAIFSPISSTKLRTQFSLESPMACGYGVCQGCTVKSHDARKRGKTGYSRVCTDGPVFPGEEICWDEF